MTKSPEVLLREWRELDAAGGLVRTGRAAEIPRAWISTRNLSPDAVARKRANDPSTLALIACMQPGDVLRSYCSPRAGWAKRAGSRGYVVLRDEQVVARRVTATT